MRIWFSCFCGAYYEMFADIPFHENIILPHNPWASNCQHLLSFLPHIPNLPPKMASITAATATSAFARAVLVQKGEAGVSSAPVIGLPQMSMRGGRVRCSSEAKNNSSAPATGMGAASMLAAVSVMSVSNPVLALVDERMSTEGTGLSLGLSNNLLGWILLGVFGLIWSLYTIYTSTLEEDEESGLSL